ncbi:U4/U6.U5 tri-snRNP-associated protein snu66 [Cyphellophora attinorum]|uniref:U4/U6.U5 tri-snRNP-associated protein snu66 n=1 Tax=Cyphellophora attinorum TaxID=1664694 RepID=A0A0N1HAC7_9EURO|nr:U4/U6.U5 tri-snRNP-associated protein snu66 [Phialophora attinorum]KPI40766.1 U4/U6.U5 tri-snRNP-associated protein snu66 [Phialophora attinorum]
MSAPDIDEINRIRKSIGLPLLPSASTAASEAKDGPSFKAATADSDDDSDAEPASTLDTREAAGYENFQKLQADKRRQVERQRRKEALQKARNQEEINKRLEGKGLADLAGDSDAKNWLKNSKKRQAEIARQRAEQTARELAEREELARVQYTSKDLAGVKVAHEVGDFEDGEGEQILTLQDAEILKDDGSEDEDVLENAEIIAKDKLKEKLDLKKKRTAYDVHADESNGLLSQYDDKKRKAFTLDERGSGVQEREVKRQAVGEKLKNTISLDILKPEAVSDYKEIKIKKPKKTKKKSSRKREEDDDDIFPAQAAGDAMDVDVARAPAAPVKAAQSTVIDDEDLSNALSFGRRAALKKQKRRPEDIAKQLKEEEEEEAAAAAVEEGGLTLDETSNFLDNLSSRPRSPSPRARARKQTTEEPASEPKASPDLDNDHPMAESTGTWDNSNLATVRQPSATPNIATTGIDEEEDISTGLGATLSLLRKRKGLDEGPNTSDRNQLGIQRQNFITEARLRELRAEQDARAQREGDRASGRMTQMSAREREEYARNQNSRREQQSSIAAAAAFNRDYKPDVQLKYVDDKGRSLNQKEAFKQLSHMFHGKGSGKGKTEKEMKKREREEQAKRRGVLSTDGAGLTTGGGIAQAMGKQKGQAGVRLG